MSGWVTFRYRAPSEKAHPPPPELASSDRDVSGFVSLVQTSINTIEERMYSKKVCLSLFLELKQMLRLGGGEDVSTLKKNKAQFPK